MSENQVQQHCLAILCIVLGVLLVVGGCTAIALCYVFLVIERGGVQ